MLDIHLFSARRSIRRKKSSFVNVKLRVSRLVSDWKNFCEGVGSNGFVAVDCFAGKATGKVGWGVA